MIKKAESTWCDNDVLPVGELFHGDKLEALSEILVDLVNISTDKHTSTDWEKRAIVKPILKGSLIRFVQHRTSLFYQKSSRV